MQLQILFIVAKVYLLNLRFIIYHFRYLGRIDNHFDDKNAKLIEEVSSKHKIAALEMETFHLYLPLLYL